VADGPFEELRKKGRMPDGTAGIGNLWRLKDGTRSRQLADGQIEPLDGRTVVARERAYLADLGTELSQVALGVLRRHVRQEVIAEYLEANILAEGVTTGKGKTRAIVSLYLQVCDRLHRSAALLGLHRRPRQLPSPLDYIAGKVDA
jgi:hypothetical protein